MAISYQDIAQVCASFSVEGSLTPGQLCYLRRGKTVRACEADSVFHGVAVNARGGFAGVVMRGFVTLSYNGDAPTVGYCPLVAGSSKQVKVSEGAREYLVVDVDTNQKTVTILL